MNQMHKLPLSNIEVDLSGVLTIHEEIEQEIKHSKKKDYLIRVKKFLDNKLRKRYRITVLYVYDNFKEVLKIETSINKFESRIEDIRKTYKHNFIESGSHIKS